MLFLLIVIGASFYIYSKTVLWISIRKRESVVRLFSAPFDSKFYYSACAIRVLFV